jgi:polyisoprenoid-binding protein YceI
MQEHFNENYLESDIYPYANYKGKILDINKINFAKDSIYKVKTKGKLTIHGVTKDISTYGTLQIAGATATIDAKFEVLLEDFNIKKPSVVAIKIADKIEVTIKGVCNKK